MILAFSSLPVPGRNGATKNQDNWSRLSQPARRSQSQIGTSLSFSIILAHLSAWEILLSPRTKYILQIQPQDLLSWVATMLRTRISKNICNPHFLAMTRLTLSSTGEPGSIFFLIFFDISGSMENKSIKIAWRVPFSSFPQSTSLSHFLAIYISLNIFS